MKKTTLIIILGLFAPLTYAQCGISYGYGHKRFTDLEIRNLSGKIKNVKYSHFDITNSFGELSKGEKKCEQEVFFNQNGTVSKIVKYKSNGEIRDVDIHEYENGHIKLISNYDKEGLLFTKTAFVIESNTIREQRYLANGKLNSKYSVRTYDSNGNMIKELRKEHDDKNDINEYLNYFDKENRLIKIKADSYSIILSYNDDNSSKFPNKIETLDIETNKVRRTKEFEFDSKGNIFKKYFNGKLSRSFEYEYDEFGNWTRKIEFKNEGKIPREIIERIINYYE